MRILFLWAVFHYKLEELVDAPGELRLQPAVLLNYALSEVLQLPLISERAR